MDDVHRHPPGMWSEDCPACGAQQPPATVAVPGDVLATDEQMRALLEPQQLPEQEEETAP